MDKVIIYDYIKWKIVFQNNVVNIEYLTLLN